MRKPKQLTLVKRYQIAILRKAGHNQTQIARHLGDKKELYFLTRHRIKKRDVKSMERRGIKK